MAANKHLLSFELSKDGDVLDIHCDDEGLTKLLSILSLLNGKDQHEHLMTDAWGGNELSDKTQSLESKLLNKVTIHKW